LATPIEINSLILIVDCVAQITRNSDVIFVIKENLMDNALREITFICQNGFVQLQMTNGSMFFLNCS
jgi:hypothetical protein